MTNEKSSLAIYIEKISSSSFDALSLDEEQELLEKAAAGDVRARDRIIRANMRFVVSVAKKYARGTAELSDLIQAGNAALFESFFSFNISAFRKSGCHRFISYAGRRISQQIALEARITCPVSVKSGKYKELRKLQAAVASASEGDECVSRAAKKIGMRADKAEALLSVAGESVSLDAPASDGNRALSELIADNRGMSVDERAVMSVSAEILTKKLRALGGIEGKVISLAYGLYGGEPLNYPAIGNALGYTREGIRVVHNRAIERLRKMMGVAA